MPKSFGFHPRVLPLEELASPGRGGGTGPVAAPSTEVLVRALGRRSGLAVLDSAGGRPRRFTLLGFDPLLGVPAPAHVSGLDALVSRLERGRGDAPPGPFAGGFLGAFAYDLGAVGEDLALPPDPFGQPGVVGGLYTDFVVVDHGSGRGHLVLGDEPGDGRPAVAERVERFAADLRAELARDGGGGAPRASGIGPLVRHVTAGEHCARIERAREAIAAGEVYQVNVAQRFTRRTVGHPLELYLRLRRVNPAPYMAYLTWGPDPAAPAGALLSASPELLLELEGGLARTRPIKGTIGRSQDPTEDAARRAELLASAKDRAELAMIVDLARNDLGRVARVGSVRVDSLASLETYATVHHLVGEVSARLRHGAGVSDALAALFPGGSITGAPKLRSMELIAELEGVGRGFFTGSLGFADLAGRAAFDILIRTIAWRPRAAAGPPEDHPGEVSFHVGGGITWRSDPVAEERETRWKGAALAACLSPDGEPLDTLGVDVPLG